MGFPPRDGFSRVCFFVGRWTGQRATVFGTSRFIVGRGPVPRHAAVYQKIAGDRPPRYGIQNRLFCRSRSPALDPMAIRRSQTTEGKREGLSLAMQRSRGTGPRATVLSTAILAVSPHQTSSASDWPEKQDPATTASLTSPAYHQTQLPRSDSNTQSPASQTYP